MYANCDIESSDLIRTSMDKLLIVSHFQKGWELKVEANAFIQKH